MCLIRIDGRETAGGEISDDDRPVRICPFPALGKLAGEVTGNGVAPEGARIDMKQDGHLNLLTTVDG